MTRLRFIQNWGPYKVGDIKETTSATTVMWLVDRYKYAVVDTLPKAPSSFDPPNMALTSTGINITRPESKFLRKPKRNKMVKAPKTAK